MSVSYYSLTAFSSSFVNGSQNYRGVCKNKIAKLAKWHQITVFTICCHRIPRSLFLLYWCTL